MPGTGRVKHWVILPAMGIRHLCTNLHCCCYAADYMVIPQLKVEASILKFPQYAVGIMPISVRYCHYWGQQDEATEKGVTFKHV